MRMANGNRTKGQALAVAGGVGIAASLWLPWYTVNIPQAALNSVSQLSQQFGALGPLIRSGAQLISQLGPFHLTAWQVFTTTPAVLLVVAIIGGGLALLALTDRAGNTSQLTILAGAVGVGLVGYRIAVPPGQGGFVHPDWAIWLALVSSLAMVGGGALSRVERGALEPVVMTPLPAALPTTPHLDPFAAPLGSVGNAAPAVSVPMDPFGSAAPVLATPLDPSGNAAAAASDPAASWSTDGSIAPPTVS
jgi:hypothetical protein